MHFCRDEAMAIAAVVPFIGYFALRFRLAWRAVFRRKATHKHIGCAGGHRHE